MTPTRWWPPRLRAELAAAQETISDLAAALAGECRCPDQLRQAVSGPPSGVRTASFRWPTSDDSAADVIVVLSGTVGCCEVRGALVAAAVSLRPPADVPMIASWEFPAGLLGAAARSRDRSGLCLAHGLPARQSSLTRSLLLKEARRHGWQLAAAPRPDRAGGRRLSGALAAILTLAAALCGLWVSRPPARPAQDPARVYMDVHMLMPHPRNAGVRSPAGRPGASRP